MLEIKLESWQLRAKQKLSLDKKIELSKLKISQFLKELDGNVHVSFSGGKDSTVLLSLIRGMGIDVPAIFVDTGLEYPEIKEFVKNTDNIIILRPQKSFKEVIERWGYPVISKDVSMAISRYRSSRERGDEHMMKYRLTGKRKNGVIDRLGVIPKKWQYLIDAPFKISDYCCDVLKKTPLKTYERKSGTRPLVGIMASDSHRRKLDYLRTGCNIFKKGKEISMPLSFWRDKDVWRYLKKNKIPYSKIYDLGEERTGCIYCMFGCHLERKPNRFQRMYHIHPKLYDYCIYKLDLRTVLNYINVPFTPIGKLTNYFSR